MTYTNSSLVSYTKLSPNHSGLRTHSIDRITPHCVVGQCSVETLGNIFLPTSRQASCNYGIGADGRVGMYVEEKNRSWCSSSNANDQRAVTIECASDTTEPYAFKDVVYQKLITLCVDVCKRNGKSKLLWLGDKDKTLNYAPKSDEMVLTVHRWFANKSCPGSWMYARMGDLAAKVTAQLGGGTLGDTETEYPEKLTEGYYRVRKAWSDSKSQKGAYKILSNAKKCADANPGYSVFDNNGVNIYTPNTSTKAAPDVPFTVKVSISNLNIRKGPGTDYAKTGKFTGKGVFTIVEVQSGQGASAGWGRLKSGAGWISLDYAVKTE
ncbi:MAG: amidase [Clostridiaceae bacterium]|nr:amidase [Clostridiaceae bacterium]